MTAASTQMAWQAHMTHHAHIGSAHLRTVFATGPARGSRWIFEAAGQYLDCPKNRVYDETLALLAAPTRGLDEGETLFTVCSKSSGKLETLTNARAARAWSSHQLHDKTAVARHFVAVSSNAQVTAAFGFAPAQMLPMWDWVGGRYSMASAISWSTMIAIDASNFRDMFAGMRTMDEHFRHAPSSNAPSSNAPMQRCREWREACA